MESAAGNQSDSPHGFTLSLSRALIDYDYHTLAWYRSTNDSINRFITQHIISISYTLNMFKKQLGHVEICLTCLYTLVPTPRHGLKLKVNFRDSSLAIACGDFSATHKPGRISIHGMSLILILQTTTIWFCNSVDSFVNGISTEYIRPLILPKGAEDRRWWKSKRLSE